MKNILIFMLCLLVSAPVLSQDLPPPYETKSAVKRSVTVDWPEGKMPVVPEGFSVQRFATGLDHPRSLYVLPNGDVLSAQANTKIAGFIGSSADNIMLLRDTDKDGVADVQGVFLAGLDRPFGMALIGDNFYVANTGGLYRYHYTPGAEAITGAGTKILALPAGGYNHHWTRNLLVSPDQTKIYITVGSASNNGEYGMQEEIRRAGILQINPDGSGKKIYASGLRNPVGMDWNPDTSALWTAVNERDGLGDDLVPDYLTSVREGGFYGWPYSYFGPNPDPRMKGQRPDLVARAIVPDVDLGAHTASLGLVFYEGAMFPEFYRHGAFIAQHGSWNRSSFVGYRVAFLPFKNGRPAGQPEDFLSGFIKDGESRDVYGRPVSVAVAADGALLVSDDAGNTIWRVSTK